MNNKARSESQNSKKIPVGSISLREAFQRYHGQRWENEPPLAPLPSGDLSEHVRRSDQASREFSEAFANGKLEARVHDGMRELTITPLQWQETFSPEHAFFGGAIIGDSPYRDLHPYTDEAAFKDWLRAACSAGRKASTVAADHRCQEWLVGQMQNGPPTRRKRHYLELAQKQFSVSERGFHRAWKAALVTTGNSSWSDPGRRSTKS